MTERTKKRPDVNYTFHSIANNVSAFIQENCEYLGIYLCQGSMPKQVLEKYEKIKKENPAETESIKSMIQNYYEALNHPNEEDLSATQTFTTNILRACIL